MVEQIHTHCKVLLCSVHSVFLYDCMPDQRPPPLQAALLAGYCVRKGMGKGAQAEPAKNEAVQVS